MTQSAIRSRLSRTLSWFLPARGFLSIMRSNPYMLKLTQPSAGIPPFRWTCRITATYASRSAGPGSPNSLPPVTLTYWSKRRPSSVMIVLRACRLSSTVAIATLEQEDRQLFHVDLDMDQRSVVEFEELQFARPVVDHFL